jgi:eukaryotic-like serine/threonine-protein kinase
MDANHTIRLRSWNLIGQKIQHYLILSQLGAGGMGVVYCALDEQLDRKVALKVLSTGLLADDEARKQFRHEALALAKLNHPNIETVYAFSSQDGLDFLAMELIPGVPLNEKLKAGPLSERDVMRLGVQMCDGLAAAHDQGVIHRDLKPANLFVTPENRLKILDFGLAILLQTGDEVDITRSLAEIPGRVTGTLPYMSPEQLRGETIDVRSDVYSAGAVMYEMATGTRAFPQSQSAQLMGAILHQQPAPPRSLNERFSAGLQAVILKALDKDPAERYQTARELRIALETLTTSYSAESAQNAVATSTSSTATNTSTVVPGRSRNLWLAGLVAAALALALGLFAFHQKLGISSGKDSAANATSSVRSTPVPASRRAIAVLAFVNASKQPSQAWLSTTLPEMLTTELGAGGNLRTISGEDVARMQSDLGLRDADSYGAETLQRIGGILGADDIVTGSYIAPGTGPIQLDLRLQNARTGETVDSFSVRGSSSQVTDLVTLIGSAGVQLRQKLGLEGRPPAAESVLKASVPSTSLAAQLYSDGIDKLRRMDAKGSIDPLQKAIKDSPDFALAHSALAEAWSVLGYDDRAKDEEQKALALAGSLTAEEKGLIQGRLYEFSSEWDKAATYYLSLRTLYQDDLDYGLRQANAQVRGGKPKDALATISDLRALPGSIGEDPRIDLRAAEAAEMLGDFKGQDQAAARAAEKAERQGSRRLAASADWHRCSALVNLGDAAAAKASCEKARAAAKAVDDPLLQARSLTGLGYALSDQGDTTQALESHRTALKLVREIGAQRDIAGALLNIGNLLSSSGDLKGAHASYQESLEISRAINNQQGIVDAEGGLAESLFTSGDYGAARNIYEDMLKTAKEVGDQKNVALALSALGAIFFEQADLPNARKRLDESLKVIRDSGMKGNYAWTLLAVGDLNLAQGQFDAAAKSYNDALQVNKDSADSLGVARSTSALALLALEQGRLAESQNLARQSADALHQQNYADFEADALATLARALVQDNKVSDARAALNRAKALPAQDQDVRLRLAISEAYILAKEGKLPDALRSSTETIQKAVDLKLKRLELEARLAKAEVEIAAGSNPAAKAAAKQIATEATAAGYLLIAHQAGNVAK